MVSEDGLSISYSEHTLRIPKWRQGLRTIADEIQSILQRLCLGQENTIRFRTNIKDNWRQEARGYGWTNRVAYLDNPAALMTALIRDSYWNMGSVVDGKFCYNTSKAWEYMHLADSLTERLLFLTCNTIGQSPRIKELLDYTFVNGIRPREMFLDDSSVIWLATRRLKTETQTGVEQFLPLKCHPELTDFFKKTLMLVRPVQVELGFVLQGATTRQIYSEYLWVHSGGRLKDRNAYNLIRDFFSKYCGVGLGVHDYRQVSIEIGRVFLGSEAEIDDEELDTTAAQAGHSLNMARWKYAPEIGKLPNTSSDVMLRFARASEKWWEITGFKPNVPPMLPLQTRTCIRQEVHSTGTIPQQTSLLPGNTTLSSSDTQALANMIQTLASQIDMRMTALQTEVKELRSELQQFKGSAHNIIREGMGEAMAAHLLPTAQTTHTIDSLQSNNSLPEANDDFEDMYADTSLPSNFPAAQPPPLSIAIPSQVVPPFTLAPQLSPVHTTATPQPDADVLHDHPYIPGPGVQEYLESLLQKHFPAISNPKFKSLAQMEAVELAISRKENFVAVLPTGGGKSLVFTLPAFNERHTDRPFQTFAVIPNKSLLQDTIRKSTKLGIETIQWNSGMSHEVEDHVQLVLLALETAASPKFRS